MKPLLTVLFFFSPFLVSENCLDYNYIGNGYYQLIYEADIAYLSGNRQLAYNKIQSAESKCPLIEQPMYYEISRYIDLLIDNKVQEKTVFYIKELVSKYGYPVESFEKEEYFDNLRKNVNWNQLKNELIRLQNNFYSKVDTALVNEIKEMSVKDQAIRKNWNPNDKIYMKKLKEVDSVNEVRIKEIFEKYGYPDGRLIGYNNTLFWNGIGVMLMHFSDTAYFKSVLLKFIEQGKCPPLELGKFVDSYARRDTARLKYIYGIYSNALDKVKDIENLDSRRKAIGMPPLELKQKRDSLINSMIDE
jgi:hypothetical protein